jgi:hypothetical protein
MLNFYSRREAVAPPEDRASKMSPEGRSISEAALDEGEPRSAITLQSAYEV